MPGRLPLTLWGIWRADQMLTFVDLFCGGGFGARGAVQAGGMPLLGVDAWHLATQTYKANFPKSDIITDKIENIDPFSLNKIYAPDVLLTSPECTSHSIARGAKPGSEASRSSALGIVDWIQAMTPEWVIVENVNRMKKWKRHEELIKNIEGAGYSVSDLFLDSANFGSPQSRKRMFLVGSRSGFVFTKEELPNFNENKKKPAKSILAKTGTFPSRPLYSANRATATLERAERAIKELGKNKPFLIVYYGSDYAGGWQRLSQPLRTVTTLDRFGLVTWRGSEPFLRMLQPEELKRAMGAGDKHSLPFGSRRDKVKLCGNGVCSQVLESIFSHINTLKKLKQVG